MCKKAEYILHLSERSVYLLNNLQIKELLNKLQERALRLVYKDSASSFDESITRKEKFF